jgi:hypothetical protein
MPNQHEPKPTPNPNKPLPDPAKGTGSGTAVKPGKGPKGGPTPDGNDQPPQTQNKVAITTALGAMISAIIGATFGVVCTD